MFNVTKLVLTTDPAANEIPLLSDLHTESLTSHPVSFQIPYQYAVGVLVKDGDANDEQRLHFVQVLKSEPYSFYHNGCAFSTLVSAFNALRSHAEDTNKTTDVAIDDILKSGKIYAVSLVFHAVPNSSVKNEATKELVNHIRIKLKHAGITDQEIMEFVRAEAKRDMDEFTAEPEETDPADAATLNVPDDVDNVSTLYAIPLIGEDENLADCNKMLKSKTKATQWMIETFFTIFKQYGEFDSGVNLDRRRFRSESLTYGLEDIFTTDAWETVVQELVRSFCLTSTRKDQLRHTPMTTRVYQVLAFIRDNGIEI